MGNSESRADDDDSDDKNKKKKKKDEVQEIQIPTKARRRKIVTDLKNWEKMTEDALLHALGGTVLKINLRTMEESIGSEDGIRETNMWQAHLFLKERIVPISKYYAWSPYNDKNQPAYLDPLKWHSVILQFRHNPHNKEKIDSDDEDRQDFEGEGLHGYKEFWPDEKCIDRYRFLKLLEDLALTAVTTTDMELRWDSRVEGHLTGKDEELLAEFDANSAQNYIYMESVEMQRPMVSVMQCGRIIFEKMIKLATKFEPRVEPPKKSGAGFHGMFADQNRAGKELKEQSPTKVHARLKEQQKKKKQTMVMAGRKRDIRQMVITYKKFCVSYYRVKLEEVHYLEWIDMGPELGGWCCRRNWAWEFLIQIGLTDLVRPIELLSSMRTNTIVPVDTYKIRNDKERETFSIVHWLRQQILKGQRTWDDRRKLEAATREAWDQREADKRYNEAFTAAAATAAGGLDKYGRGSGGSDLTRAKQRNVFHKPPAKKVDLRDSDEDFRGIPTWRRWGNGQKKENEGVGKSEWALLDEVAEMELETLE